ncbi:MAG TPA: hypothetical protein VFI31_05515 [Pirellulales bacterium]|nr:hypothetical protein [Pirellulales bacterium]
MKKEISDLAHEGPHFEFAAEQETPLAWEEVEQGRFMPRRVRGSCQGRALG